MTIEVLKKCMPFASAKNIENFIKPLNDTMVEFDISNPKRMAAFLAQIAHESGSLRYVREIALGSDYDTGKKAANLGNTPEADGDGQKYKGRGLIQVTGFRNYSLCGKRLKLDLIAKPELLEIPINAARSAGWFWSEVGKLNPLADKNDIDSFKLITKRINGGFNGLEDRVEHWERCKKAFGI